MVMKNIFYLSAAVLLLSSCVTTKKTASTADITSSLQSATVADLDVRPRVSYTMTPSKAVQRGGLENVKRTAMSEALEKNGGGDLMVNPEFTISKRRGLFSSKITSITVTGRPATYTNVRSFNDSVWCNPVFRGIVAASKLSQKKVAAKSQSVSPKQKVEREYDGKKLIRLVRVGVGANKFAGIDDSFEGSSQFGYSVGLEFNRAIKSKGAYWGMDFTFASRGYEVERNTDYQANTNGLSSRVHYEKMKLYAHTFQWTPFTFGWKIRLGNSNVTLDPHIGVFASFDLGASWEYNREYDATEHIWVPGYYAGGRYHNGYYRTETHYNLYSEMDGHASDGDGGDRFDVGLKFGIGLWFNDKVNVDFTVQRGFLRPEYASDAYSYTNGFKLGDGGPLNLMFRLGYAF